MPGVHSIITAKDIPGNNNFTPPSALTAEVEKLFVGVNDEILFYGQPAGIVLADTMALANLAASKIKITYIVEATGYYYYIHLNVFWSFS